MNYILPLSVELTDCKILHKLHRCRVGDVELYCIFSSRIRKIPGIRKQFCVLATRIPGDDYRLRPF
jgi:hypothetical protein